MNQIRGLKRLLRFNLDLKIAQRIKKSLGNYYLKDLKPLSTFEGYKHSNGHSNHNDPNHRVAKRPT